MLLLLQMWLVLLRLCMPYSHPHPGRPRAHPLQDLIWSLICTFPNASIHLRLGDGSKQCQKDDEGVGYTFWGSWVPPNWMWWRDPFSTTLCPSVGRTFLLLLRPHDIPGPLLRPEGREQSALGRHLYAAGSIVCSGLRHMMEVGRWKQA